MTLGLPQILTLFHFHVPCTHTILGLKRKPLALIKRLRKAKKEAPPMEKPAVVKTQLRNMIVVPEMIGSVVGIHNGKVFNQVEIKVSCSLILSCSRNQALRMGREEGSGHAPPTFDLSPCRNADLTNLSSLVSFISRVSMSPVTR